MSKQDSNAAEIVSALRAAGCVVRFIEGAHGIAGVPDLLVGYRLQTFLLEVKVKRGRLSKAQVYFHALWNGGPLKVVRSIQEALEAVGLTVTTEGG
jgi:hypothetical protein